MNDETKFTSETTNHGNTDGEIPRMMSPEGKTVANKTAPQNAFQTDTKIGRSSGNDLHDSMAEIFKR